MKSLAGSPKHAGRATRWCRCALVFLTSLPLVRAVDVSGDYEATGRIIASALEPPTGGVSLHGLLALEFDLALARQLFADTTRVTIRQTAARFLIECRDAAGAATWRGEWQHGVGYVVEDEAVKLEFRSAKRYGNDAFVFRLANDPRRHLLVLSVRRITPSTFGPGEKELGVFCFAVLPPAPKSPRPAGRAGARLRRRRRAA